MICSTLDPVCQSGHPIEFRGRKLSFWISHRIKNLSFIDISETSTQDVFILLFSEEKLIDTEPEFFVELTRKLEDLPIQNHVTYTVAGHPFYIVPVQDLKAEGIQSLSNRDKEGAIKELNVQTPFRVLSASKDCLQIESVVKCWQIEHLHENGVIIEDFDNFYMEGILPLGKGTRISSGVVLKGNSVIGNDVTIFPRVFIENSVIKDKCSILPGCVIRDSALEENVQIGPYAHLRNGAILKRGAKVGNFVEVKKSIVGEGSKAMHLTYLGDAEIGENVNVGAGTITCNFDGRKKNKTIIENGVFIGSGTELIAPIVVGENSYVGAGSTVNQDVPPESLAIARQKQRNIRGWGKRKKKG